MENSVLRYFQENLSKNIVNVSVHNKMAFNPAALEEIINELNALDRDKDTGYAQMQAALALTNPQIKKDMEKSLQNAFSTKGKDLSELKANYKANMVENYSQNYSRNMPLSKYLSLFEIPSIKRVEFSPQKHSRELKLFSSDNNFSDPHQYVLDKTTNVKLDLIFRNSYPDYEEKEKYVSITIEDNKIPPYAPSDILISDFSVLGEKWPYPEDEIPNSKVQNRDIMKYFKEAVWNYIELNPGDFNNKIWEFIIVKLEEHSFLKPGIAICDQYKRITNSFEKPFRIIQGIGVPCGEMNLIIGTNLRYNSHNPSTDICLEYKSNNSKASLYIENIGINSV